MKDTELLGCGANGTPVVWAKAQFQTLLEKTSTPGIILARSGCNTWRRLRRSWPALT